MNQPWRAAVAAVEVLVAVLLVFAAVWCWNRGVITMVVPKNDSHPELVSTRFIGSWVAGSIGIATLAGLLLLGAIRQLLLALRTKDRQALPLVRTVELPPA
ncbi:hypothetical protein BC739_008911 [Kutzneria viridogrisea]|uniref:Uncharacterized protein n=1 Tax=Kutzneria viridogrisea TaxID=47990 RepID=A0ABR6BYP1_9PSEU|nr:hypothetical protein [Kutzneria albida]MBA8931659.1 hypothetical protein [Kutzneria viridogrisea]